MFRRGNGEGSVFKSKDRKRRKPWRARFTEGWEIDEETGKVRQVLQDLGYFATRAEAEAALVAYKECPYDIKSKDITFKEVYEKWSDSYFESLSGVSSQRTIMSAYSYCSSLYKMRMRDIRVYHLEECLERGYVIPDRGKDKGKKRMASACTKSRMKSMFNLMYDWAYARDIVDKNYARAMKLDKDIKKEQKLNKRKIYPFTADEIKKLWEHIGKIAFADMVLVGIYSGWRPQELAIMKINDVDLESGIMVGGLKTDAGRNRTVPIHPEIYDLVKARYEEAKEMESAYLFNDRDGQQGTYMTYDKYRRRFDKVVKRLDMGYHHPHETRHTFITYAKKSQVDEYVLKELVGHAANDITEEYTHRTLDILVREMEKVTFDD